MRVFLVIAFVVATCLLVFLAGGKTTSPRAAQAVPREAANDPVKAEKCKSALVALQRSSGAWRTYKRDGSYATVEVGPAFYLASFGDKQLLDATMRCVLSNGRPDNGGLTVVQYLDYRNHHEAAIWSDSVGFTVK